MRSNCKQFSKHFKTKIMARQKGILPIEGTLGNITFFKSKDGFMAREKGGVSADKIANSPNFQRTRENNAEFGRAGKAAKLLRSVYRAMIQNAGDSRMISRLLGSMLQVIRQDAVSIRGQRNVLDGELEILQGFECNINSKLSTSFFAPFTAAINRVAGTLELSIPAYDPSVMLLVPAGATHYRLIASGAAINFENESFEVDIQPSAYLPFNNQLTAALTLTNTVAANSPNPLFLALSIEFVQDVNGQKYPLKNGALNAMAFVKIEGV
jgi:hypothetical protein